MEKKYPKQKNTLLFNILFVIVCGGLFLFLLRAPEESTAFLPRDDDHIKFFEIKSKKAAEKFCDECHGDDGDAPLPENHPPKYRCLFCHKRVYR